jgi:hypothetical protein
MLLVLVTSSLPALIVSLSSSRCLWSPSHYTTAEFSSQSPRGKIVWSWHTPLLEIVIRLERLSAMRDVDGML